MLLISILLYLTYLSPGLVLQVSGHGFVHKVIINGQEYPGWNPFSDPYNEPSPRVTRKVASDGFVAESDPNLACHQGGDEGTSAIAEAPAGSDITFDWAYWPGDHQGPVTTYMASCGDDCSSFSANNAQWFKIDASGYSPGDRQWGAGKLIQDQSSWTSRIPANLLPGEYLVRNEIIALHSVTPQFYPSCVQIRVTGSGTGRPSSGDLMTMQQVYGGATWPNIYLSSDLSSFEVPGPPLARLDGSSSDPNPEPVSTTTRTRPPPVSTSTGTRGAPTSVPTAAGTPQPQCVLSAKRRLVRRKSWL